jgi:hypothetical protein
LTEWLLRCKTGDDAAGGVVIVHVPSHDLWADASLGLGGYVVSAYHAVLGGHFAGDLRPLAEAGLLDLPKGAKLQIAGYASLRRHANGEWHVGFDSSCPDNGLPCEFRDGRGSPSITSLERKPCNVTGFTYPAP